MRPRAADGIAMQVRPARLADLDAVLALENASFAQDRMSRRAFRAFIAAPHRPVLVANVDGVLAGHAVLALRANSRLARLYSIAVDRRFARLGVGRGLLQAVEAACAERGCVALRLEVRKDNGAAIALYHRQGYRPFGEYPDYYQDGAAALRMQKKLGGLAAPPN